MYLHYIKFEDYVIVLVHKLGGYFEILVSSKW
jgi:hypothetical protein